MEEIWRNICGYEGLYHISNYGRIKSVVPRYKNKEILKPMKDKYGYLYIWLYKDNKRKCFKIHRIVARAFPEICGEWFEGAVVNHKDENKSNNVATNLEVCSVAYNTRYGTSIERRSKKCKKKIQSMLNGVAIKKYNSIIEAANDGFSISGISQVLHKKRKTHKGYNFIYI